MLEYIQKQISDKYSDILYDLSEYQHILMKRWIRTAYLNGFINKDLESKVLNLDDY